MAFAFSYSLPCRKTILLYGGPVYLSGCAIQIFVCSAARHSCCSISFSDMVAVQVSGMQQQSSDCIVDLRCRAAALRLTTSAYLDSL